MKDTEFIRRVKDIEKNYATLYVMGCFGAPLTGGNVARYCNNHSYNRKSQRTRMIKAAADKTPPVFGFDCVNLIKAVLWGWTGDPKKTYGGAIYKANGVPDIGADQMIATCKDATSSSWGAMVPGEVVWTSGHIGVYIGNGLAVECTPSWANRVQTTAVANIGQKPGYNARRWKKHGRLPWVEYTEQAGAEQKRTTHKVVAGDTLAKIAAANGTTVQDLAHANGLKNPNVIHVGEVLMMEDSVTAAVDKLTALGVINSPDYWKSQATKTKYLDILLKKAAQAIKKAGRRAETPEKGLEALVKADVINSPDYWAEAVKTVPNMGALLCALGGSV